MLVKFGAITEMVQGYLEEEGRNGWEMSDKQNISHCLLSKPDYKTNIEVQAQTID